MCGFFERERAASSDSLRFLALNLSSPLARVQPRVIQVWTYGATASIGGVQYLDKHRAGGCASWQALQRSRPSHGNQMAGPLFQRLHISGGGEARHTHGPCRVATIG